MTTVSLGGLQGHDSPVRSLAVHGDLLFATHYHSVTGNEKVSPGPGSLVVLDRVSLAEVARVGVGWQPRQVVVNPTARRVYVLNYGGSSGGNGISIIGLDSLRSEGELKGEFGLVGLAVDATANVLYALVDGTGEVVAYDCADHTEIARVAVGRGLASAVVDEANRLLFVTRTLASPLSTTSWWSTPSITPSTPARR